MADHAIKGKNVIIIGGAKTWGDLLLSILPSTGRVLSVFTTTVTAPVKRRREACAFQADLTSAAAMEKLFNGVAAAIGRPDIAINTVGKVLKKPMAEITEAEFDDMSAVNAKAVFFLERSRQTCA